MSADEPRSGILFRLFRFAVAVVLLVGLLAGALHLHTLRAHRLKQPVLRTTHISATLVYHIVEGKSGSSYPYTPDVLRIPAGQVVAIKLTDYLGGCGLVTVFPRLAPGGGDARARVPVGTTGRVSIRAPRPGRYPFHCSGNMYFGTIVAH
ncbi:MAG: hypothetical protein ACYCVY_06470 [Acidiferrobacteraceae bacterium]